MQQQIEQTSVAAIRLQAGVDYLARNGTVVRVDRVTRAGAYVNEEHGYSWQGNGSSYQHHSLDLIAIAPDSQPAHVGDGLREGMPRCPNCPAALRAHPENGCALAVLIAVVRERGSKSDEELAALHANCDVDALWDRLGPIADDLESGLFSS